MSVRELESKLNRRLKEIHRGGPAPVLWTG
jgi:hypothetical protein